MLQIHDDVNKVIEEFSFPKALFTQPINIDPKEIAGAGIMPNETPQENRIMFPRLTHPSPQKSPPVDAPETPASPPPHTHE